MDNVIEIIIRAKDEASAALKQAEDDLTLAADQGIDVKPYLAFLEDLRSIVRAVREQSSAPVVLGGAALAVITRGDILEFAAVLSRMALLICNNSGPLHLAGLLGVPTISFMGPTIKTRWWPRGPRSEVMRRDQLPCIGCNRGYCRIQTHACMTEITPDQAFQVYQRCY